MMSQKRPGCRGSHAIWSCASGQGAPLGFPPIRPTRAVPMRSTRGAWGVVLGFVAPAVGAAQTVRPMFGLGIGLAVANGAYHSDKSGEGFDPGWVGSMLVGFKMPKTPVFVRVVGSYSENGANEQLQG